jgi:hypothetical protein
MILAWIGLVLYLCLLGCIFFCSCKDAKERTKLVGHTPKPKKVGRFGFFKFALKGIGEK